MFVAIVVVLTKETLKTKSFLSLISDTTKSEYAVVAKLSSFPPADSNGIIHLTGDNYKIGDFKLAKITGFDEYDLKGKIVTSVSAVRDIEIS